MIKYIFYALWSLLVIVVAVKAGKYRKENPPEIVEEPTVYKVKLNDTICLPCKVKKQYADNRKRLFYWKKDGSVVLQWPRYRLKPNKCLRIRNIRSSDHAKYVCYVRSETGTAEAVRNLIVTNRDLNDTVGVLEPPPQPSKPSVPVPSFFKVIKPPQQNRPLHPVPSFFRDTLKRTAVLIRKYFYLGRRAKLKCAVVGSPPPKIKWFHFGVPLEGSKLFHIRSKSYALIIDQFSTRYNGNYTCVGSNRRGIVNMSFIVSNKSGDPNPPPPLKTVRTVTEGENITLSCSKPAKEVKWLVWHTPNRELRKQQNKGRHRDYKPFRYLSEPQNSLSDNGSIAKYFYLYNISHQMHSGVYKCLAVYRRSRNPVPVKIIELKIKQGESKVLLPQDHVSSTNKILFIAFPVMGALLTLVVVTLCFRCRRKPCFRCQRKTSVSTPVKPDEDDTLSMQILPNVPTGTLRIHKSLQEFSEGDQKFFGELMIAKNSDELNSEKYEKTSRNSPCLFHSNHKHGCKTVSSGSCYSLPETNPPKKCGSSENVNLCEKELNSKFQTSNIENCKKHRCKRLYQRNKNDEQYQRINNDELHQKNKIEDQYQRNKNEEQYQRNTNDEHLRSKNDDHHSNSETMTAPSYNSHCGVVDDNIPALEIPESPEEEDQLLQREMKNWEPLIRDSTAYVCDRTPCDGELLRYDRTAGDGETCRLLNPHSSDLINLISARPDSSQHII